MLRATLVKVANNNQRLWDQQLPKIACALRTSKHETTGYTPYFLNFGREIVLNGTEHWKKIANPEQEITPELRSEELKNIFNIVHKRIQKAGEINKKYYDLRRRPEEFVVGQKVWKKNFVLSDATKYYSSKLAPSYVGPYTIEKKLSPWTYELKNHLGKVIGVWHAKDLKAHPPDN